MPNRHRLFISYSHADKRLFEQVRQQLRVLERARLVDVFDDTQIQPGEEWYAKLHEEMLSAKIGMLLVSAPFLDSDFILEKEIPTLFLKHEQAGMIIYPLLLRPCPWQEVDWLSRMQIRPRGAKAISTYRPTAREQALADVAREIAAMLKSANPDVELDSDEAGTRLRAAARQSPVEVTTARFEIVLDEEGAFVDEASVRASLVEALEEFEAGRQARIEVVSTSVARLVEEIKKYEGGPQLTPGDREALVKKRRQIRYIEETLQDATWCLNVAVRDGAKWHFGEPEKLLAIADHIVAKFVGRKSSRSDRELIFRKLDIFRKDQSCGGSFTLTGEEGEALLQATSCTNWADFITSHAGWNPIDELPTMLLPTAFASMVLAVHRFKGPDRTQLESSLRRGEEWGFGPG